MHAAGAGKKRGLLRPLYRASLGRVLGALFRDQIPCEGCVIDTSDEVIAPRVKAKLFLRGYEHDEIRFVKRHLRRDLDVIELGSSLGVVAAHIARKLDPGRRLVCVEANPALLKSIWTNVHQNAPHARLDVVSGAVEYPPDVIHVHHGWVMVGQLHLSLTTSWSRGFSRFLA